VGLSANAMPDAVQRARQAGFDDYWTKPIDVGQFLASLDRLAAARVADGSI
jgi:CheY-like chemotaxis protein